MIASVDPNAKWQGWGVLADSQFFGVGVSEGDIDSTKMVSCTTVAKIINTSRLIDVLTKEIKQTNLLEETENMQRHETWNITVNDIEMYVQLTTIAKKKVTPLAILSVIAPAP